MPIRVKCRVLRKSHKMTAFVLEVLCGVSDLVVSQVAAMATVWLSRAHCRPTDPCSDGIFPWVDASESAAEHNNTNQPLSQPIQTPVRWKRMTPSWRGPLSSSLQCIGQLLSLSPTPCPCFSSPSSRVSLFIHLIRFHSASLLCLLSPSLILNRQTQQCY